VAGRRLKGARLKRFNLLMSKIDRLAFAIVLQLGVCEDVFIDRLTRVERRMFSRGSWGRCLLIRKAVCVMLMV